jgi:hypothetical protein
MITQATMQVGLTVTFGSKPAIHVREGAERSGGDGSDDLGSREMTG